jgi:hypothetical protein
MNSTLESNRCSIPVSIRFRDVLFVLVFVLCWLSAMFAGRAEAASTNLVPTVESIRSAIAKSLPLLETASRVSMERRQRCYTCHNQGLVVMALTTARDRGFAIDAENLRQQLQFTADFLAKNQEGYVRGRGQGGGVDTAGYALWTLELGGWKPDATTAAVATYLPVWQKELDHWEPTSHRPPTQGSHFTSTHAAWRGLRAFGTGALSAQLGPRWDKVREWLARTPVKDTEDRVFQLRMLRLVEAGPTEVDRAKAELLREQRPDGGWSQLANQEADAYATATALVALHEAGDLPTTDAAYLRGLAFLLSRQLSDGSWHVKTRATPVQEYYESGYPHGEDQFISIYAAGWSTTALALSLPKAGAAKP